MKIHPSLNYYEQLTTDELLSIFLSRIRDLPDTLNGSDLSADSKELIFVIILRICDLSLLDITPNDLFDLSKANALEFFAILLENLSVYEEALNKERGETRSSTEEEKQDSKASDMKEEPSSKDNEWESRYNELRYQLEQLKMLLKQVTSNENGDLSEIIASLTSSDLFFDEESNESILALLIKLVAQMMQILSDKTQVIEDLEARVRYLNQQLYAPKSERRPVEEEGDIQEDPKDRNKEETDRIEEKETDPKDGHEELVDEIHEKESETGDEKWKKNKKEDKKKKKGAKKGHKGYGRKVPTNLPVNEIYIPIPEKMMLCPKCGTSYRRINNYETSYDIEQIFTLTQRIFRREKAVKDCNCEDVPTFITAPLIPKIIPESKYSTETWIQYLVEKYFLQIPLNRQMRRAMMYGHKPCDGTIAGGLKKFIPILKPLYELMIEAIRKAKHWHVDETSWRMFIYVEDKENYRWWLWVFIDPNKKITIYVLDPYRSSEVPLEFFKAAYGIINVDRYCGYSPLEKVGFIRAFCWYHLRRDFDKCGVSYPQLKEWAEEWIAFINEVKRINDLRVKALKDEDLEMFTKYHYELKRIAKAFEAKRDEQLESESLHKEQRKILKSMKKNREGYFLFIDNPIIPMDNNAALCSGIYNPQDFLEPLMLKDLTSKS